MRGAHGVDEGGLGREGATPEGGGSLEVKYEGGSLRWRWRKVCGRDERDSWCRRGGLVAEKARALREVWRGRGLSRTARDGGRHTVEARLFVPLWAVI